MGQKVGRVAKKPRKPRDPNWRVMMTLKGGSHAKPEKSLRRDGKVRVGKGCWDEGAGKGPSPFAAFA